MWLSIRECLIEEEESHGDEGEGEVGWRVWIGIVEPSAISLVVQFNSIQDESVCLSVCCVLRMSVNFESTALKIKSVSSIATRRIARFQSISLEFLNAELELNQKNLPYIIAANL